MAHRGLIALVLSAVLFASSPTAVLASPDVAMCVAEHALMSTERVDEAAWRAPMCGPFFSERPAADPRPLELRAIEAFLEASERIVAADYDDARLQLDLAARGLPRISDHIALRSGRLELLRQRPAQAAEFFARALEGPHDSVRVEARFGYVFALLRIDDPAADEAFEELLRTYPALPNLSELLYERALSLIRQQRFEEASQVLHTLRVEHPGSRTAPLAEAELRRLRALGQTVPAMSDEDRVRRARRLVQLGPLDEAKAAVAELLDSPLTGTLHAEVHYLAGRLARFEGRWKSAETYMRTAQLFAIDDPATARSIASRAEDMAEAASARDPDRARLQLAALRAGRRLASIPSTRLVDMIEVASPAGLKDEVDELLLALSTRKGAPTAALFDGAMAAVGTGSEGLISALLREVAMRPGYRYRAAAIYHLARAHERAGRVAEASLFFAQTKATATLSGDPYYALWADIGLARVDRGETSNGQEGLVPRDSQEVPPAPRVSNHALADYLRPIARRHQDSYPWIARAEDLLRIDERDAATAELFEAYLSWRHALGRPIARAGLDCVARDDSRIHEPLTSELRSARLGLSEEERDTLSSVAAALGDMGTAGGFAGTELIERLPRAYEWLVVPAANRYGLDPNLLLAVMRVESAYQKHIVSYAGAVGLMQIMPRTGQLIAHALGHDHFTPADLLKPSLNVEFAAWYLASLIRRFDGRLPLAIAAYNGGPHNVRRWMQQSPEDTPLDVLLEQIPFTQTHRYVRKVLTHYEAYRGQRALGMPQLAVQLPEQRVDPLAF